MLRRKENLTLSLLIFAIALVILGGILSIQYIVSYTYHKQLASAASDLKSTAGSALNEEKTRQEALKLRLENEQRSVFLQSLLSTISTFLGIIVAISGIWVALGQYLSSKERERLDRASKDFESIWTEIGNSSNPSSQASAIAALQSFLSDDKSEYHDRVAAALALVSRMKKKDKIVIETLKPIVEKAMRQIPASMRSVSWQGTILPALDFARLDLSSYDFRDSTLIEANFSESNLQNTRFDAANLTRAIFKCANLHGANLRYCDLVDASFSRANLRGSNLQHIKLMNVDFHETDLEEAQFTFPDTDWRLARGWRSAKFSSGIKDRLIAKYGPPVEGPHILMLLWEYLPNVSGGLWTAAYHMLHNLRSLGADISVAVPQAPKDISFHEFGNEIALYPLGGEHPIIANVYTSYDDEISARTVPIQSGYYAYSAPYDSIFQAAYWFGNVVTETVDTHNLSFDVIHAHDWLTFPAAEAVAKLLGRPWIAHFHSTERDRRQHSPSKEIERIESEACQIADAIVVPSSITKGRLITLYGAPPDRIKVVPNCISRKSSVAIVPPNNRAKNKVVFLGRVTMQKGPDYFIEIARYILVNMKKQFHFTIYGDGDMKSNLLLHKSIPSQSVDIIPNPQTVAPSEPDSPQRYASPIEIEKIAPAEFDEHSKTITTFREATGDRKKALLEYVFSKGFIAYSHKYYEGYTHLIQIEGDLPENVSRSYSVKAYGLETISSRLASSGLSIVDFEDKVKWSDRYRVLSNASLVVVPSRSEPFGMVVLEAMQQGIPVLFCEDAGVGEVIRSGIKIKSEDIEGTARKIVELLEDETKWRKQAELALKEVTEYPARGYETKLMQLWSDVNKSHSMVGRRRRS